MANDHDIAAFRAQNALTDIHEARRDADHAIDALIASHQNGQSDQQRDALQSVHIAVMRLYNRVRPYLSHVPELANQKPLHLERDEEGNLRTRSIKHEDGSVSEQPIGVFGLYSLDNWRFSSVDVPSTEERLGEPNSEQDEERPIHMPKEMAVHAYDALQDAIVQLEFAAEPGSDVPESHLDDAPDTLKKEQPAKFHADGGSDE
ncbi:hypothetical protein A4G99_03745 [Haladaptatus sp. R4]|uniref:hypothetical protein n=1 Tax=Haladaptatus sp. R4 TaxID=1679489 RepID=UPI0007B49E26|nr:hypothetical protein [Haladaptatus sp. R4]KZN25593.1 hypothetical protein A4G99_03745 [Haladaptatus sp. R4]